ncbi:type 1 glutamine amidotransferase domain-containing protein [Nostocales cyanobacterium LEGE 11386]|nr:type 1 glutamine amidotransferase domain-containing protein [Nostocales cyanobacterium LEGE 11386]
MFNLKKNLLILVGVVTLTGCFEANAQRTTPANVNRPNTILMVLTSHDQLGNTGQKTGFYLDEAAHPYSVFTEAGFKVEFVSPNGGAAPVDPTSYNLNDQLNQQFVKNQKVMDKLNNTLSPQQVKPSEYKAIFFAGGHGTMWDFPDNQSLAQLTSTIYEQGGVVGAVCHGPAGLVNVQLSNGAYLVAGKTVAAFTNEEEEAVGLTQVMPFLLESKLIERGAKHTKAPNFQAHVVVSERLVTGQNPASATGVAQQMVHLLNQKTDK